MTKINFLETRRKALAKVQNQDRQIFVIALFVFIVCLTVFVGITVYRVILNTNMTIVKKRQEQTRAEIKSKKNVELAYLIFTKKLAKISKLFTERSKKQEAMNYFTSLLSEYANIFQMKYEAKKLTLTPTTLNVFTFEKMYEILQKPEVNALYTIEKSSVSRNQKGAYSISVAIPL